MYNLLIADDEFEIRNGLSNYFPWSEIGFQVVGQAANGKEVLQFIDSNDVHVILCDIQMPEMTGIEVAKTLFESKSPIQLLFLSGHQEFSYAQSAIQYGVRKYILKPTKYDELHAVFSDVKKELDEQMPSPPLLSQTIQSDELHLVMESKDSFIRMIREYVLEEYQLASLEGASQLVHLNPHYISKYFKEKTAVNFSDFVLIVKMNKAAELLTTGQYKIYEISELVGYSNAKNFTRTFRKYFGKSPREMRNDN